MSVSAKLRLRYIGALQAKQGESKNGGTWISQDFIFEEENPNEYSQHVVINAFGDKIDIMAQQQLNTLIDVSFNIESRQYTDKNGQLSYFTGLKLWKIEAVQAVAPAQAGAAAQRPAPPPTSTPAPPAQNPPAPDLIELEATQHSGQVTDHSGEFWYSDGMKWQKYVNGDWQPTTERPKVSNTDDLPF